VPTVNISGGFRRILVGFHRTFDWLSRWICKLFWRLSLNRVFKNNS